MTGEEIRNAGIPLEGDDPEDILTVESGLEWLAANTILEIDMENMESIKALPSRAKLFLLRFLEVSSQGTGITSESIGGLSQSFDTSNQANKLNQLAQELIWDLLKSQVKFIPGKRRW